MASFSDVLTVLSPFPTTPLHILHINDAYELEPMRAGTFDAGTCLTCAPPGGGAHRAPCAHASPAVGGASRCKSVVAAARAAAAAVGAHSLLVHSGDAFSPSILSAVTRGAHMVPVLQTLGVDVACVGNHELDVGVLRAGELMRCSGLPWVLSNLTQRSTGLPLCDAAEAVALEVGPWRVGVVGLVEASWVETLATVKPAAVAWEEPLAAALRLSARLREAHGVHVVLALTHMRLVNDVALREGLAAAERAAPPGSVRPIDAILGGHDHDLAHLVDPTGALVPLLKSGSDFRFVSRLVVSPPGATIAARAPAPTPLPALPAVSVSLVGATLTPPTRAAGGGCGAGRAGASVGVSLELFSVGAGVPLDAEGGMEGVLAALQGDIESKLARPVGLTSVPLDARETMVRTRETNIGNMIADLMRRCVKADIALLNGGTIRANALVPPGVLRARHLVALLPFFGDVVVRVRVAGAVVLRALENSVSRWPAADGRFCQVSGVRFAFDPARAPGSRVVPGSVQVLVKRVRFVRTLAAAAGSRAPPPAPAARASAFFCARAAASYGGDDSGGSSSGGDRGGDGGGSGDGCSSGSESEGDGGRLRDTGAVPFDFGTCSPSTFPEQLPTPGAFGGAGLSIRIHNDGGEGRSVSPHSPPSSGGRSLAAPPLRRGASPTPRAGDDECQSPSVVGLATVMLPRGVAEEGCAPEARSAAEVPPLTLAELAGGSGGSAGPLLGRGAPGGASAASPRKQWAPLDPTASYTVAIKNYLLEGKDGYAMFEPGEGVVVEVPEEGGHSLPALLSSHLEVLQRWDGDGGAREAGGGGGQGAASPKPSPPTQRQEGEGGGARAGWNSPRGGGGVGDGGDVCLSRSAVAPRVAAVARVPSGLFSFVGSDGEAAGGAAAEAAPQLPRSEAPPLPDAGFSLAIAPKVEGRISIVGEEGGALVNSFRV
jgi:5'-nucleotidase